MSQNNTCFTLSTYLNAFANLTLKSSSKKKLFNSLLPISELDFICLALFNATLKELSFLFLEEFILQHGMPVKQFATGAPMVLARLPRKAL